MLEGVPKLRERSIFCGCVEGEGMTKDGSMTSGVFLVVRERPDFVMDGGVEIWDRSLIDVGKDICCLVCWLEEPRGGEFLDAFTFDACFATFSSSTSDSESEALGDSDSELCSPSS
jgi:hypothetical protein